MKKTLTLNQLLEQQIIFFYAPLFCLHHDKANGKATWRVYQQ